MTKLEECRVERLDNSASARDGHWRCRTDSRHALDHEAIGRYVLSRRTPQGGYSYYRTPEWRVEEPSAPDTLAALESLRLLGIEPPEHGTTAEWLRQLQDDAGGYPSLTIGWGALRSLALLDAQPKRSPRTWLSDLGLPGSKSTHRTNSRGMLRDLLHVLQLSRLVGTELHDEKSRVSLVLHEARNERGGWASPGPELATSAVAIKVALLCELKPEHPETLGVFVRNCEDRDLGFRLSPTGRATSVEAIWGGLEVLRALELKPSYPQAIATNLALTQRPDGGVGKRHRALTTLQATWIGLDADRLLALTEQEQP